MNEKQVLLVIRICVGLKYLLAIIGAIALGILIYWSYQIGIWD